MRISGYAPGTWHQPCGVGRFGGSVGVLLVFGASFGPLAIAAAVRGAFFGQKWVLWACLATPTGAVGRVSV